MTVGSPTPALSGPADLTSLQQVRGKREGSDSQGDVMACMLVALQGLVCQVGFQIPSLCIDGVLVTQDESSLGYGLS